MTVLTAVNGFLLPPGAAGAVTAVPQHAGSNSGLLGFFQLGAASLGALTLSHLCHDNLRAMSRLVAVMSALAIVGYISLIRRPL